MYRKVVAVFELRVLDMPYGDHFYHQEKWVFVAGH